MIRWICDWLTILLIPVGATAGFVFGQWVAPEPVIIERTDTLYLPPVPEFIEMFRLQCEWVAR